MIKIKQTDKCRVFFTSDPHYGQKNIVAGVTSWVKPEEWPIQYGEWTDKIARTEFCRRHGLRDFGTIEEMNDALVSRFNNTVREDDVLFILGDVAFGGPDNAGIFMSRLRCKNVYLVYGNHDHNIRKNINLRNYFNLCEHYMEVSVDGQMICLFHYAARVWNRSHHGSWFLYGHSHGCLPEVVPNTRSMDVGVDTNDLTPYSFDELKVIMDQRPITIIDGHHS